HASFASKQILQPKRDRVSGHAGASPRVVTSHAEGFNQTCMAASTSIDSLQSFARSRARASAKVDGAGR
ncbi:hypothetical protein, partial [Burkholderia ubonensis]|uniref:hypothetical protein n=1 Tax=Burkholderia ubonensis TaxID=101571 RepID=UPI001E2A521A